MAMRTAMPTEIGIPTWSAPVPARARMRRISSVAYALDERASEAKTARPVARPRRSWTSWAVGIGWPSSARLTRCIDIGRRSLRHPREAGRVGSERQSEHRGRDDQGALLVAAEPLVVPLPEVEPERLGVSGEAQPAPAFRPPETAATAAGATGAPQEAAGVHGSGGGGAGRRVLGGESPA